MSIAGEIILCVYFIIVAILFTMIRNSKTDRNNVPVLLTNIIILIAILGTIIELAKIYSVLVN